MHFLFQKYQGKIMRRILRKIASDRPDELGDVIFSVN
jgi:acyl-coenzyme A synthetase/AMP-(fatty) acid ligase